MSRQATPDQHEDTLAREATDNDRLLEQPVRETEGEPNRLARLSMRVTGVITRPEVPRAPLLDEFDRCIGGGDLSLGRLGRVVLLYQEEMERATAEAWELIDITTGRRVRHEVAQDVIHGRVLRRLAEGDVIPAILFRERPHLAHLAPFVETIVHEERERRGRARRHRASRSN